MVHPQQWSATSISGTIRRRRVPGALVPNFLQYSLVVPAPEPSQYLLHDVGTTVGEGGHLVWISGEAEEGHLF